MVYNEDCLSSLLMLKLACFSFGSQVLLVSLPSFAVGVRGKSGRRLDAGRRKVSIPLVEKRSFGLFLKVGGLWVGRVF